MMPLSLCFWFETVQQGQLLSSHLGGHARSVLSASFLPPRAVDLEARILPACQYPPFGLLLGRTVPFLEQQASGEAAPAPASPRIFPSYTGDIHVVMAMLAFHPPLMSNPWPSCSPCASPGSDVLRMRPQVTKKPGSHGSRGEAACGMLKSVARILISIQKAGGISWGRGVWARE